jgi:hypothetical protein
MGDASHTPRKPRTNGRVTETPATRLDSGMAKARSTILPDPRRSPRFAGLVTFGRSPRLEDVDKPNLPLDWAIYGVPFDGGVTYRPGARFGPRAVQRRLAVCQTLLDRAGRRCLRIDEPRRRRRRPRARHTTAARTPMRVTEFAACTWEIPARKAARARRRPLHRLRQHQGHLAPPRKALRRPRLIHFDSHLDTVDAVWGEKWGHASPFIRAIEDGLIDPQRMISASASRARSTPRPTSTTHARHARHRFVTHERWQARARQTAMEPMSRLCRPNSRRGRLPDLRHRLRRSRLRTRHRHASASAASPAQKDLAILRCLAERATSSAPMSSRCCPTAM